MNEWFSVGQIFKQAQVDVRFAQKRLFDYAALNECDWYVILRVGFVYF